MASEPLRAVLREFSSMSGLVAEFREEKHLALLQEPLVSEGTLYFAPPGLLAREVHTPVPSIIVADEHRLWYSGSGDDGWIDLDTNPTAAAFVSTFRLLLTGDVAGLEKLFEAQLAHPDSTSKKEIPGKRIWELRLEPRNENLKRILRRIRVRGASGSIFEFRILDAGGDESATTFHAVDTRHHFTESELTEHFGVLDR
jgi:hypothetical protein